MSDSFADCWRKVEWAKHHLQQLTAELRPDARNGPYATFEHPEAKSGDHILTARVWPGVETRWSLIIGDVVMNLRAALDYSICAHVRRRKPRSKCRGYSFPISDRALAEGEYRPGLRGLSVAAKAIIESLQPHNAGNAPRSSPLWVLDELSTWHKHRALPVVGFFVWAEWRKDSPGETITTVERWSPDFIRPERQVLKDGTTQYTYRIAPPGQVKMNGKLTLDIAFDEAGPLGWRPVFPLLGDVRTAVEAAVRTVQSLD